MLFKCMYNVHVDHINDKNQYVELLLAPSERYYSQT